MRMDGWMDDRSDTDRQAGRRTWLAPMTNPRTVYFLDWNSGRIYSFFT